MVGTIAWRELRSLFLSPLAWTLLGTVQILLAYLFLRQLDTFQQLQPRLGRMEGAPGVTDIVVAPLFSNAAIVLLLIVPLVTMHLISGERRAGTISLVMSAPISMTRIVLGKYLGVLGFLAILLGLILLMPLSLSLGTTLDVGKLGAGALGLALVLASFAAAGVFLSSLTNQPAVAAIGTFGLLLLLWLLSWTGNLGTVASGILEYLSLMEHYRDLGQGLVNTADIAFYLLFIVTFLVLTVRRMDADRLAG